jgi:hypothetical protein
MKKSTLILVSLSLMFAASTLAFGENADFESFASGNIIKYCTKGHPKAKGINISVEYPNQWRNKEGDRPNIVQKIIGGASEGLEPSFLIIIKNLPESVSAMSDKEIAKEMFTEEKLKGMIPAEGSLIEYGQIKYDGQPGCWMAYWAVANRARMKVKTYNLSHMFVYKKKLIGIMCMLGGLEQVDEKVKQEFNSYLILFQRIGLSISVDDN